MSINRRVAFATITLTLAAFASESAAPRITTVRVPDGGLQPEVVLRDGVLHMIYLTGAPEKADIIYRQSKDYGQTFSKPLQVNTKEFAMALGNIRGPQLAIGRNGRPHIAWNGVNAQNRMPMFYSRLNDAGTGFEPERNLINSAWGLDGGGAIAADAAGNVYAFWHAPMPGTKGEENRRVWVAKSSNDGGAFEPEHMAFENPVGACGCCGMKAWADADGTVYAMFRSAQEVMNRDIWLLTSKDHGKSFTGSNTSHWNIGACVMSSESLSPAPNGVLAAWETEKQAWFGMIEKGTSKVVRPIAAPGEPGNRKHPVAIANKNGDVMFAWTDGMAWKKPGTISWQLYNAGGKAISQVSTTDGVPAWSLIAGFAKPDGSFVVVY